MIDDHGLDGMGLISELMSESNDVESEDPRGIKQNLRMMLQ